MADNGGSFHLSVLTRDRVLFEGDVFAISSINDTGKFDVLPRHMNFISLIKDKIVIKDVQGKSSELKIGGGVLRVKDGGAQIFLGIGG